MGARGTILWLLVLGGAATLHACRSPTQITVVVTTDAACKDTKGAAIAVGPLDELERRPSAALTTLCTSGRVGTLVVVPGGARDAEIGLKLALGVSREGRSCIDQHDTAGCIIARRALHFIAHEPLTVSVPMRMDCLNVPCGVTETCVNGACRPARITDASKCVEPDGCDEKALPPAAPDNDWARTLTNGQVASAVQAVAVDFEHNVLVTGRIASGADLGNGPSTGDGADDLFLLKLSPTGKHIWSKRFEVGGDQHGDGIAVDGAGNVIVTGHFEGTLELGGSPLASLTARRPSSPPSTRTARSAGPSSTATVC